MAEKHLIGKRNQGCALTAEGHIVSAEVTNSGDTGASGNVSGITQLQGAGRRRTPELRGSRLMPDRLSMGADRIDGQALFVYLPDDLQGGSGENFPQTAVKQTHGTQIALAPGYKTLQLSLEFRLERHKFTKEELDLKGRTQAAADSKPAWQAANYALTVPPAIVEAARARSTTEAPIK